MPYQLGTPSQPLRVAIIGAGPAGLYAANSLLKQQERSVQIDIFDRSPAPYGLVRYGVAPDHQKIKGVTKVFDKVLAKPEVRFFGNVIFGTDLTRLDLHTHYDQILYAVGAQADRRLNIPGEDLAGSLSATEFVAWYNGHPDYRNLTLDLSGEQAIVVGAGNVAIDVARILVLSKTVLAKTDMAEHALDQLAKSNIKRVHILARRGPAQAQFTPTELKELADSEDVDIVVNPADLELDAASTQQAETDKRAQRNLEQLHFFAERPSQGQEKRITFCFLTSPLELIGSNGSVERMRIEQNRLEATKVGYLKAIGTGEVETIRADLVLRSVGYKGGALLGVPFDEHSGTIPNEHGRVLDGGAGHPVPGEYVVGWAKRGPSGVIGTNKPDAAETVEQMLVDLPNLVPAPKREPTAIEQLLLTRRVRTVNLAEWQRIDEWERATGEQQDRPRAKMTSLQQVLDFLDTPLLA